MFFNISNKSFLTRVFKISTVIHIICLLASLITHPYIGTESIFNSLISYVALGSILCISLIISIKIMNSFKRRHKLFIINHKFTGLILESFIIMMVSMVLFINKELTMKGVLFLTNLSKQAHSNQLIVLIVIICMYLCFELYEALQMHATSINSATAEKSFSLNFSILSLKLLIFIAAIISFSHPSLQVLYSLKITQLDSLVFDFTTIDFFLYLHEVMITLFGLWIIIGVYFIYKLYIKRR